jgi:hypothetical protein
MKEPIDQLSWLEFLKNSKQRKEFPKKVDKYNRLIAHSKNFFVISGYGAFTDGYMLIVSKEFIPSYGLIKINEKEELHFLVSQLKNIIKNELSRKSVEFEHGMCACIGGLDRAHLHIMSMSPKTSEKSLIKAINETLYARKAGIKHILYNNYKLENIHDINHIYESLEQEGSSSEITVVGKIYDLNDIKNLDEKKWPLVTLDHIKKGGHYVYFKSDYFNSSFLTTNNFQTQFGRQVVFNNELNLEKSFKKKIADINVNDVWKWQNSMFEENILNTMKIAKKGFLNLSKILKEEFSKYEIKIC